MGFIQVDGLSLKCEMQREKKPVRIMAWRRTRRACLPVTYEGEARARKDDEGTISIVNHDVGVRVVKWVDFLRTKQLRLYRYTSSLVLLFSSDESLVSFVRLPVLRGGGGRRLHFSLTVLLRLSHTHSLSLSLVKLSPCFGISAYGVSRGVLCSLTPWPIQAASIDSACIGDPKILKRDQLRQPPLFRRE